MTDPKSKGVASLLQDLEKDFQDFTPLIHMAKKLKIESGQIVIGWITIVLVLLLIGAAESLLNFLVGMLYPAYMSFKALETENNSDITQWLIYWLVFALFYTLESFLGFLLQMIPFYFPIKIFALIWMFYPKTKGASTIYSKFLKPTLENYRPQIDDFCHKFLIETKK